MLKNINILSQNHQVKIAEKGLSPEAVAPDIYYRCHPNKMNSKVICILCDNVYHKSHFYRMLEKKTNIARYVTNVLVVCDEHDFDITSNRDTTNV